MVKRALKRAGLADDTIIVFSTDNGGTRRPSSLSIDSHTVLPLARARTLARALALARAHALADPPAGYRTFWCEGAPSVGGFNYPYKGQKSGVWEGGMRTPALFNIPPSVGTRASQKYDKLIHISDFAPTLLGLVDRSVGADPKWLHAYTQIGHDIDGIDHAGLLLGALSSGEPINRLPLDPEQPHAKGLVLEFNAFFPHTAYIEDARWKLVLGRAGREDLFDEPTGAGYDAAGRLQYRVEETICDFIDVSLGDNWFVYSWALRFLVDMTFDRTGRSSEAVKLVDAADFGDTITITESRLPAAKWQETGYVKLFDLKADPLESTNVAEQHKDRVEAMVGRVRERVRNDPGHNLSVQKQFIDFMRGLMKTFAVIALIVVLGLIALIYKCSSCSKRVRPAKLQSDPKKNR
jgi:hypothetical protein